MNGVAIIRADARAIPLRDECVQCVVTSPPYWGLRKYSGDQGAEPYGLEPTIDYYVKHTVEILREIRRVLRPDGVVFWNIGDSYHSARGYGGDLKPSDLQSSNRGSIRGKDTYCPNRFPQENLKPKDLCLIPARVAIAAQADGWWVRSEIIWRKRSPMPESVQDRPTRSHEFIYMLTKSERYFYDWRAAREPLKESSVARLGQDVDSQTGSPRGNGGAKTNGNMKAAQFGGSRKSEINDQTRLASGNEWKQDPGAGANWRDVWDIASEGYAGAHFAVFPTEIPRRCILAGSRPGDLVLDPFGGSGTTARVAVELNRRAVSIDLAYHDHAEKRTKEVQRNLIAV